MSYTLKSIEKGLKEKQFSAKELTEQYLERANQKNAELNVYLEIFADDARANAQALDESIAAGKEVSPLMAAPIAMKDNLLIEGHIASSASKILKDYKAVYDATVTRKLKKAGSIFIGQANMDEFAMGASTENSAYGPTLNPHDVTRVSGGSSGGSAAAVAADMAVVALGSDTGGSIRQPAHFCGVVGLKPTYGAVSRYGLMAMASSLDQIGPITKTVEDAKIVFNAIKGKDAYDNTSRTADFKGAKKNPVIGIPKEYFTEGLDPEVAKEVQSVIDFYKNKSFEIKEISLPHTKYALSAYYIINPAEVSSNLARYDAVRYSRDAQVSTDTLEKIYKQSKTLGFGEETKRRIMLGTFVLSSGYYDAYYKKALQAKDYIADDFTAAFKGVDVILTPVAPTKAFKLGERAKDPLAMYLADVLTIPASLAGLPAISVPVKTNAALPGNFQLIAPHWHEEDLFSLATIYQNQ
ncbi:MAG: Asp-tRNA(Asn)/Glu-tRNA(Gln) amidotransferase subunit GatA [Candidatus Paceibacterota bacterium]